MSAEQFSVGAGKAVVHWKKEDFPLEGFCEVHDDVFARAIVLKGEQCIVLLSLEMTSLPPDAIVHFKSLVHEITGIPAAHILISVTHTFSVPHLPRWTNTDKDKRLSAAVLMPMDHAVQLAVCEAVNGLREASVGWGVSPCGININRNVEGPNGWWIGRNEREYSNHLLCGVTFFQEQNPIATIIGYDCQPSVLDQVVTREGKKLISGDMAGEMMRLLEYKYEDMVAVFIPGSAGDQTPLVKGISEDPERNVTNLYEDSYLFVQEFGRYLRDCAEGVIRHPLNTERNPQLRIAQMQVELPEQVMQFGTRELMPHRQFSFELTGKMLSCPVTKLTIGEVTLLLTAPELNSNYGEKLRTLLGGNVMIGTMVDGSLKYMPQEQDYDRITYTAMNTMIGRGADQIFFNAVKRWND